jgi:hypothetical protein
MHFRARSLSGLLVLAAALIVGCKDSSGTIPHTPTHIVIVSGTNQSGGVSAALDSSLVVQVLDGAGRSVSGVPLTWNVIGGGTLSAASTTSDADGKSTVKWTLAPAAGTQVVTVTSAQITGASVSFVANNGATISGNVSFSSALPFGAAFSRTAARPARLATRAAAAATRRPGSTRIVVGFKNDVLGIAAAASGAYRSISVARDAALRIQQRSAALMQAQPMISRAEVSPAILATRFHVSDSTQVDVVMASLRADPSVAYVERDGFITIRDGAPRPMSTEGLPSFGSPAANGGASVNVAGKFPNDPGFYQQSWPMNMLDLPKAWTITTGSKNVTVAVVDMGIRFDHPETAANLTTDGYDFVSLDSFPTPETMCDGTKFSSFAGDGNGPDSDPTDPDDVEFDSFDGCWVHNTLGDHGLWTAGIIGAAGNDAVGVAGVNWNVKIRPVRVLGIDGGGSFFDIAQGVLYAAGLPATGAGGATVQTSRAPIINMSLGGGGDSPTLRSAIASAIAAGSLVVASAGNDGLDINTYPAAYPGVMGVASVGMDGNLATYSNAGTFISVSAPGGDFRLDDNGGGGVLGPGWNFSTGRPTYLFGYGTSASAPFVSGIAALMLAQDPTLTGTAIKSRIEQYASRGNGLSRSDVYGWGIVNAYNALTQQNGATHSTIVRLVDATSGLLGRTTTVDANGNFVFTKVLNGSYYVQAGNDESGDGTIGNVGRVFGWAGGFGKPTVFNVNGNSSSAAMVLGLPTEVEPNDDIAHANLLSVNGYVVGTITTPDLRDVFSVAVPTAGVYTFETSGLVGTCGFGVELDTFLSVASAAGTAIGSNDNFTSATGHFCSRVSATLTPGIYYVTVTGTGANGLSSHGRYRLEVRSGT